MTRELHVGDHIRYRDHDDRVEVTATIEKIDKLLDRLLVSWANGTIREWIQRNDVLYVRGERVIIDNEIAGVIRNIEGDGDIRVRTADGTELWYRTRLTKA